MTTYNCPLFKDLIFLSLTVTDCDLLQTYCKKIFIEFECDTIRKKLKIENPDLVNIQYLQQSGNGKYFC